MAEQKTMRVGPNLYLIPSPDTRRADSEAKRQRMAVYLAWVCQPKDERQPRTKTEMAAAMGVTVQTLFAYERDPEFGKAVSEKLGQSFRVDRLPDLFERLYQTATDPENPRQVAAARTLLEWLGRAQDQTGQGLADMTVEDLERIAAGG
jgi:DNA-binding XRE family transcriptional regulator